MPTDVSDPDSVAELFDRGAATWGRVDLLVNNAGVFGPAGAPDEIPVGERRSCVDTNLTGAFLCARAAFGVMRRQDPRGGRIIDNGSVSAHSPRPGSIASAAPAGRPCPPAPAARPAPARTASGAPWSWAARSTARPPPRSPAAPRHGTA
ncbi:oxidoreductase [Amycolatopsis methanolica 239]|uniref:Oxidoreductase n=1 Tax=Amycolatopsis methanolica 239 TaxID=1068978 RepID=A0A076MP49_AMYME|nr:oxidoreductase [Amycolatopsis methanolica 239]